MTQYVHCVRVYETICKPYLTAQIIIYDTNNIIENLNVTPGMPSSFAFHSPPNNTTYSQTLVVLNMKGEQAPGTLKYQIYTLNLIGTVYFQDRMSTVQYVGANLTGTAAIQNIWSQYLGSDGGLNVMSQSSGMIGTTQSAYSSTRESPITAIYNIMKKLTSSQYQTGNWLLYRDAHQDNLTQLEQLMNQTSTAESFIQKETWGIHFNDADLYRAIIVAQMEARGEGDEIAGSMNMTSRTFDIATGSQISQLIGGSIPSGIGGVFSSAQSFMSQIGGNNTVMKGYQVTDSSRWDNGTAPFTKTQSEAAYSASIRNGPRLVLKVPMQTGLNVTVGKQIYAQLMPPTGDLFNFNYNSYALTAHNWLCTDLCHELYTDQRQDQATTTLQNFWVPNQS